MFSELRFNSLKGEWVLFAPQRSSRTKKRDLFEKRTPPPPKANCPFEHIETSGNLPPHFYIPEKKDWHVCVFPNKFPGVHVQAKEDIKQNRKFHMARGGYGYHDVLITRQHNKSFARVGERHIQDVFLALQKRYKQVSDDPRIEYIAMFQNWGVFAGASLYHPHMQIIALPIIPSHITGELIYALRYFERKKSCLYCDSIAMERREKKRIVYENKGVIAFVPYAAQEPYEVLLFPKKHEAFFERSDKSVYIHMAQGLSHVLLMIEKKLKKPNYNLYIHTAPAINGGSYPYHHWYMRILPKSNYSAGFELGTGIEINTVLPEDAARLLKTKN